MYLSEMKKKLGATFWKKHIFPLCLNTFVFCQLKLFSKKGNSKKYLRAVFHLILSINLLVLSNESSPDFDMTAQNTFVLQYQKLGMIQCLKLKDLCSKSTGKPFSSTF